MGKRKGGSRKSSRGNPWHRSDNGQFTGPGATLSRYDAMENDIQSYLDKKSKTETERMNNMKAALYDGGYIENKATVSNCGFKNAAEMEAFVEKITTDECAKEDPWREHKKLVETYLQIAKGYISKGDYSNALNRGEYSETGKVREESMMIREYGWGKQDIEELVLGLKADDFVNSGKNISYKSHNRGTVVMVFSPKIKIYNENIGQEETIDLYVKLCLNPHPGPGQKQMQLLSVREMQNDHCVFTGEKRNRRIKSQPPTA